MESLTFVIVGIVAYGAAHFGLDWAERRVGRRFEHRTLIFFGLMLVLTLGLFQIVNWLIG